MKKIAFFVVMFIILGGMVWGQGTYTWQGYYGGGSSGSGGTVYDWYLVNAWSGGAAGTYPSEDGRQGDTVIFPAGVNHNADSVGINIRTETLAEPNLVFLNELIIDATRANITLREWNRGFPDFNITTLTLNGRLDVVCWQQSTDNPVTNPADFRSVNIQNLNVTNANARFFSRPTGTPSVTLRMNGAPITIQDANNGEITIGGATYNQDLMVGSINAPGRVVRLTVQNGNNIFINDNIDCARLIITAQGGTVTIADTVTINATTSTGAACPIGGCTGGTRNDISMSIDANHLVALGTGAINPTGFLALRLNTFNTNNARFPITRLDLHGTPTSTIGNIVYGNPPANHDIPSPFTVYDPTDASLGANRTFTAAAGFNIYVVNVDAPHTRNLTFTTSDAASFIEFRGDFNSSGTLTLNPGTTGGVRLNNANITLTGATNNFAAGPVTDNTGTPTGAVRVSGPITLNGTGSNPHSSISAANIFIGNITGNQNNLTLTTTGAGISWLSVMTQTPSTNIGDLVINGNASFGVSNATVPIITANSVSVIGGTSDIRVRINTPGGTQTYGAVRLQAVAPASGSRILQGDLITLGGITGGDTAGFYYLEIIGNAVFNGANTSNLRQLSVTGTSLINGNITTTTQNQTYTGAVTIGHDTVNLTGNTGTTILFSNTVNSNAATRALTITNANVTFNNIVGTAAGSPNRLASITVTGGTTNIGNTNTAIFTSGNQSYAAIVFPGAAFGARALTSTNGSISASGIVSRVNEADAITFNASQGINLSGNNTMNGTGIVSLQNTQGAIPTGVIIYNSAHGAGNNLNITAANNAASGGNITINAASGNITIPAAGITAANGAVSLTTGVDQTITIGGVIDSSSLTVNTSGTGVTQLNANVTTSINQTYNSPVVLGVAARTLTGGGTGVSNVLFSNTVNGAFALNIVNANVTFNMPVGTSVARLASVAVNNGGTVTAGNNTADITIFTSGIQTYSGNINLNAPTVTFNANANNLITFDGTITGINGNRRLIISTGNVHFNGAVGANDTILSVDVNNAAGSITSLYANITTIAARADTGANGAITGIDFRGPVQLGANVILTTKNSAMPAEPRMVRFRNTVNRVTGLAAGTPTNLTIIGDAMFAQTVGTGEDSALRPTLLEVSGVTRLAINNGNIFTNGNQTYTGQVTLEVANFTLNAVGNTITFGSFVRSNNATARNLNLVGANINFNGAVGSVLPGANFPIGILNITGASAINANITTTGNQTYNGAVTFGGTDARTLTSSGGNINITGSASRATTPANYTGDIAINTSQGITMNGANTLNGNLNLLNNQGAASGNINIINTSPSLVLVVANSGAGNLNVNQTGVLTANGINNTNGVVTLTLPSGDLNITASINAQRLSILANITSSVVTVQPSAAINTSSNNDHDTPPNDGTNASIYVRALTFNALLNSPNPPNIIPGSTGIICLEVINFPGNGNGRIDPDRLHWHVTGINLVYTSVGTILPPDLIGSAYQRVNVGDTTTLTAFAGYNIYIVDAVSNDNLIFTTSGAGYIEFRGTNNLTGATVTFTTTAAGGLRFRDGSLNRGNNPFAPGPITLVGAVGNNAVTDNSITAASLTMAAINGGGNDFTLTATGAAGVTFTTAIPAGNNLRNLTVNGQANVNAANINTIQNQTYNGIVVLGANVTFTGAAPPAGVAITRLITFANEVIRDGTATRTLTITNANVSFGANVGRDTLRLQTVTVNGAVTATLNGNIFTTGNQTFGVNPPNATATGGTVILNNNITFSAVGAAAPIVRFNASVEGTGLTVTSTTARIVRSVITTGSQTYNAVVQLGQGTVNNDITFSANAGNLISFANTVNSNNANLRSITITDANVTFTGNVGAAVSTLNVNGGGITTIHGNVNTSGVQNYSGQVVLAGTAGTRTFAGTTVTMGAISAPAARSLTINGNAVFNGAANNGIINLLVSGTATLNNASITTTGTVAFNQTAVFNNTSIINNGGIYTQSGVVTVNSIFRQTGAGGVTLGAGVHTWQMHNTTKADAEISFASAVNLPSAETFTFISPPSGGTVRLSAGLVNNNFLIIRGGSAAGTLDAVLNGTFSDVTIGDGTVTPEYVRLLPGTAVRQPDGSTLELGRNTTLDTSAGSWFMRTAGGTSGFSGFNGTLNLGTGSNLIVNALDLSSADFLINNTGLATISARGNVNITNVDMPAEQQLIFEMIGNGASLPIVQQSLLTNRPLSRLHIRAGSQTNLSSPLEISGEIVIEYIDINVTGSSNGILNAGNNDVLIYAGLNETKGLTGRWRIINAPINLDDSPVITQNAFIQNAARAVHFIRLNSTSVNTTVFFEITGNTVWRNFICHEPGAVIQFSTALTTTSSPDHHVFLGRFDIKGDENTGDTGRITLTRLPPSNQSGWPYIYNSSHGTGNSGNGIPPADFQSIGILKNNAAERVKFWNFNLIDPVNLDIEHVFVYFSHAWYQPIIIETTDMVMIRFHPYYSFTQSHGYFNFDWREEKIIKIFYSFVEDASGNGRADRIRVQAVNHNGDFTNFKVYVDGYGEITSISAVPGHIDSFYINLAEKPYLYDGRALTWRVTDGGELRDNKNKHIANSDGPVYSTINTIPPRISYVITLPGYNQTFIQMSQPVAPYSGVGGTGTALINGNPPVAVDTIPRLRNSLIYTGDDEPVTYNLVAGEPPLMGALSFIAPSAEMNISDLASLPPVGFTPPDDFSFLMQGLWSIGERALDWSELDSSYPAPKYPTNWNYSGYAVYSGNTHIEGLNNDTNSALKATVFVPPFRVLTPAMMVTLESGGSVTPGAFTGDGEFRRRSTDVLVSLPPNVNDSANYFAWPVWARYDEAAAERYPGLTSPGSSFWSNLSSDMGIIWDFDGTKYLEEIEESNEIIIQVHINKDLLGSNYSGLNLYYGFNVPASFRNPQVAPERGNSAGGLWLPVLNIPMPPNPRFFVTPELFNANNVDAVVSPPLQLSTFRISTSGFRSGGKVEFLLKLEGITGADPYLYIARLDIPRGSSIPGNWYRLVRPFAFDIQNVVPQRGGVTIMNNVINSDNREVTYLRYHLVRSGRVTIQVHTLDGTLVRSIKRNEHHDAGEYTVGWDGSNNSGRPVARGMYFIRVVGPDIDEIRKVMVVR